MADEELSLKLTADNLDYKRAFADLRVSTARDLAAVRTTVATSLNQARVSAAQSFAGIRQTAAAQLGQTRVAVASQLAQIKTQTARDLSEIRQNAKRTLSGIGSDISGFGGQMKSAGTALTVGLTAPLAALAAVSTRSALQLDTFRNRLLAVEGSAAAAESRITRLRGLAQDSVGVTTRTALDAYSQFAVIGDITERTIERQIKAFGRLNAAFTIDDPQLFNRNLTQIFTQNFEIKDIREALGRISIFNQLLESAFGTSDPEKLRELKAAGKITLDSFLAGLAGAVESSPTLSQIQESLSVRLQKTFERIQFALAPIGESILKTIEPFVEPTARLIERIGAAFASLPDSAKLAILALGGIAAIVGPAVVALGALVAAVGAVVTAIGTVGAPLVAGVAAAIAIVVAASAALVVAWQTNFGGIQEITTRVLSELSSFARDIMGTLIQWWQQNLPLLRRTVETVLNSIRQFWATHGQQITALVTAAWQSIKTVVGVGLNGALSLIRIVLQIIDNDWKGAWDTYQAALGMALRGIGVLLSRLPGMVEGIMNTLAVVILTAAVEIRRRAEEAGEQIGRALVLSILRGISSIDPQAAIAGALIIAISGAGTQATQAAAQQGSQAGQAYLSAFKGWLGGLGQPAADLTTGVGEFVAKPAKPAVDEKESKKAAAALTRARAAELEAASTAADTAFKKAVDDAEAAFVKTGDFIDLIGALKRAEEERWVARKVQFDAERAEIRKQDQLAAMTAAELHALKMKEEEAQYAHLLRLAELDQDLGSKRLAALQQQHKRELELEEQQSRDFIEEQKRRAESGLTSFAKAERLIIAEAIRLMGSRQAKLEEEAEAARGNAEAYGEIAHQLALLKGETERFVSGASASVSSAIGKDIDRIVGLAEDAMERLRELASPVQTVPISQAPGQQDGPRVTEDFGLPPALGILEQIRAEWRRLVEEMSNVSPIQTAAQAIVSSFRTIHAAAQEGAKAWLLYGQSVGVAIRKALAEHLAGVAAQAGIMALFHAAYAIGSAAFGNFAAAAKHALAALKFGALAVVAGVGAKVAAGNLFSGGGSVGGAGALADGGGGVAGGREDNRTRYQREQEERDLNTRRESRRSESLRLDGPVIVQLDGREVGRGLLRIIKDGGDLQDGFGRALRPA